MSTLSEFIVRACLILSFSSVLLFCFWWILTLEVKARARNEPWLNGKMCRGKIPFYFLHRTKVGNSFANGKAMLTVNVVKIIFHPRRMALKQYGLGNSRYFVKLLCFWICASHLANALVEIFLISFDKFFFYFLRTLIVWKIGERKICETVRDKIGTFRWNSSQPRHQFWCLA